MVTATRPPGSGKKVFVGSYILPEKYVVESNAGQGGLSYDWAVRTYVGTGAEAYSAAEEAISGEASGPTGMLSLIGSQVMNLDELHLMRPSMTVFPSPIVPPFFKASAGTFLKAALEEVCYSISCNIDIVEGSAAASTGLVRATGGMTRCKPFCGLLSDVTSKRVLVSSEANGTLLGAALCAMVGSGMYSGYEDAVRRTIRTKAVFDPDKATAEEYAEAKQRWKELYLLITSLIEEGKL
jgi:sugar (pentulose or hexulose) kinase